MLQEPGGKLLLSLQQRSTAPKPKAKTTGGGVLTTHVMHGRSRNTKETLAYQQRRDGARRVFRHCSFLASSAKRRELFGESYEGLAASY